MQNTKSPACRWTPAIGAAIVGITLTLMGWAVCLVELGFDALPRNPTS